jgi:hypothetical protein
MSEKAPKFIIAESSEPGCSVVIARDANDRLRDTVADVVRVVELMAGPTLPVVVDGLQAGVGREIHIGLTDFVRQQGLVPDSLPVNGYRIATCDENGQLRLAIAGPTILGTTHGVYGFLSDDLGVMWGMGDPLFEDVPARPRIEIGAIDCIERPVFGFRTFPGGDLPWCRRNRIDDGNRTLPYYGHSHNMHAIMPPNDYRDRPEYFAFRDGKRIIPDGHFGPQPCMTHPDVIRIGIEAARRYFDENPTSRTFSLCPNDTKEFCECPNCTALDEGRPLNREVKIYSDSYFHWVEAVAKAVLESHPDKYLGTYGYWATVLPPRQIKKLPPNVVVYLTVDSSQYYDAAYEKYDFDLLTEWRKVADHVVNYDYYALGWFMPRVYTGIAARTIKRLSEIGVAGFHCEAYIHWAHNGGQFYLASRLTWDAKLDPAKLLDEWYTRMFGEAAPQMRAFYDALERRWMELKRPGRWFEGFDWIFAQFEFWPADARQEVWDLLDGAYAAAKTEITRRRVDYVRRGHRSAYLMPLSYERALALSLDSPTLERDIRLIGAALEDALNRYRRDIKSDTTYGSHYYIGTTYAEERNFAWWQAFLGDVVEKTLVGKPDLRAKLVQEDATIAEILRIREQSDGETLTRIGWVYRDLEAGKNA